MINPHAVGSLSEFRLFSSSRLLQSKACTISGFTLHVPTPRHGIYPGSASLICVFSRLRDCCNPVLPSRSSPAPHAAQTFALAAIGSESEGAAFLNFGLCRLRDCCNPVSLSWLSLSCFSLLALMFDGSQGCKGNAGGNTESASCIASRHVADTHARVPCRRCCCVSPRAPRRLPGLQRKCWR